MTVKFYSFLRPISNILSYTILPIHQVEVIALLYSTLFIAIILCCWLLPLFGTRLIETKFKLLEGRESTP